MEFANGQVSVRFSGLDLKQALEQTGAATGVLFSVDPEIEDSVHKSFDELPLKVAIRRLLTGYNYVMLLDKSNTGSRRIQKVIVMSKAEEIIAPAPQAVTEQGQEVILQRNSSGYYVGAGTINGQPVNLLVDTGATMVTISGELAKQLNVTQGVGRIVETANGRTEGFGTVLDQVTLGQLKLDKVKAIIVPNMNSGRRVLLGMNFLAGFEIAQQEDQLIIKKKKNGN